MVVPVEALRSQFSPSLKGYGRSRLSETPKKFTIDETEREEGRFVSSHEQASDAGLWQPPSPSDMFLIPVSDLLSASGCLIHFSGLSLLVCGLLVLPSGVWEGEFHHQLHQLRCWGEIQTLEWITAQSGRMRVTFPSTLAPSQTPHFLWPIFRHIKSSNWTTKVVTRNVFKFGLKVLLKLFWLGEAESYSFIFWKQIRGYDRKWLCSSCCKR